MLQPEGLKDVRHRCAIQLYLVGSGAVQFDFGPSPSNLPDAAASLRNVFPPAVAQGFTFQIESLRRTTSPPAQKISFRTEGDKGWMHSLQHNEQADVFTGGREL